MFATQGRYYGYPLGFAMIKNRKCCHVSSFPVIVCLDQDIIPQIFEGCFSMKIDILTQTITWDSIADEAEDPSCTTHNLLPQTYERPNLKDKKHEN
ncbi:MAG: hypothetical protein RBR67_05465 [Desulfobacterium sp.]|nr:hypothetical protein [Desulfobacterium sp.]